jgi:capsid assembly protease
VVTISGALNNTDSWLNEYRNASGYPEIREALIHAAKDPEVVEILLDIKSGGGAVSGVTDTADLIRMVDTKVKPVHAFSDGMIASAAYWLGSSARKLTIGKVTEAGSVGVITVHQEYTKMLEEAGITPTVIRAGKYKALGTPYEKLSDLAQGTIQAQLDQLYGVFIEHVADRRGVSVEQFDKSMGQGRVFIGQDAVDVGLVDAVSTFDAVVSDLQRGIDSRKEQPKYGANFSKGNLVKNALTEQDIAAMASGAAQTAAGAPVVSEGAGSGAGSLPEGESGGEDTAAGEASASSEGSAQEDAPALATANAQVALLKDQLAQANDKIVELQVQAREVGASLAPLRASLDAMRPVVQKSVANLRVAMGGSAAGVEALDDGALLAEHGSLAASFTNKFKVGGVAAVSSGESTEKKGAAEGFDAARAARIRSTRPSTK